MLELSVQYLSAFLCGILDRWRGSDKTMMKNRIEWAILGLLVLITLLGLSSATALIFQWQFIIPFLLLFCIPTGWGRPIGSGLKNDPPEVYQEKTKQAWKDGTAEWYQRGPMAKTWQAALTFRGFMWGFLPAIPLYFFAGLLPAIALTVTYTAAMPLAVIFANRIEGSRFDKLVERFSVAMTSESKKWSRHELYRGWLVGLFLLAFSVFI